jgi:RNA polymerase sigma factor (sigma-70 family)
MPPAEIVAKVRAGDRAAWDALYRLLKSQVAFAFWLVRPQDREDYFHRLVLQVIAAVERGQLRDPKRLVAFARTIARRRVADYVEAAVSERERSRVSEQEWLEIVDFKHNPEEQLLRQERRRQLRDALRSLPARDVEVLRRFYLDEQPMLTICAHLGVSERQFALVKTRAKAKLERVFAMGLKRGCYARLRALARAA